jgi:transcriptional repressor NrdR
MKCQFCNKSESQVLESRVVEDGKAIRRRRECLKCHRRFTTLERIRESHLWVVKKDGKRELFDREKIKRGILRAIEKRPVSLDLVEEITESVEGEILKKGTEEVPTKLVGNLILKKLKAVDKVAWLRFASVYLEFEDISDFERAIEKIAK